MWGATNTLYMEQEELAYVLKRDPRTIRVIAPEVGGSFGGKGSLDYDTAAVCHLAVKLGRPIKWIEDRTEYMTTYHAREMDCEVEAAVTSDGTILALRFRSLCDIGAYFVSATPVPVAHMVQRLPGPYKTPVMHVELRGVATNKPTTGPYRGAGGPEATYFMERTVDVVAAELGLDPTDVRRKNLLSSSELPYTIPTGYNYDSGDYPQLLERVLALARYDDLRLEQAQARTEGRLLGIDVATFIKPAGAGGQFLRSTARVEIEPEGDVKVYTEASPHGQGTETTFAQIAADVLGVLPGDVAVLHGDTAILEFGVGSFGSRGIFVSGSAVYLALQEARNKLSQIAADLFKCTPEEVEFLGGRVWHGGDSGREASFADITARAFLEETLPEGLAPGLEFSGDFTLPDFSFPSGAQVALVEVDQDTGEVKIVRCVGIHDCGRIINPKLVEGQMHGGIMQGIGQAMTEAIAYTPEGQPLQLPSWTMASRWPRTCRSWCWIVKRPCRLQVPLGPKGQPKYPSWARPPPWPTRWWMPCPTWECATWIRPIPLRRSGALYTHHPLKQILAFRVFVGSLCQAP